MVLLHVFCEGFKTIQMKALHEHLLVVLLGRFSVTAAKYTFFQFQYWTQLINSETANGIEMEYFGPGNAIEKVTKQRQQNQL